MIALLPSLQGFVPSFLCEDICSALVLSCIFWARWCGVCQLMTLNVWQWVAYWASREIGSQDSSFSLWREDLNFWSLGTACLVALSWSFWVTEIKDFFTPPHDSIPNRSFERNRELATIALNLGERNLEMVLINLTLLLSAGNTILVTCLSQARSSERRFPRIRA